MNYLNPKTLRIPSVLAALFMLIACDEEIKVEDDTNVISKFSSTWNIYEKSLPNEDGSITYKALPWGGLVGNFLENNMPVDLSAYESICFEFSEPTPAPTQVVVGEKFKTWGKKGIRKLTCNFDGQDVTSVGEIVLQAGDTCTLTVTQAYLVPNDVSWESKTIWKGNSSFGHWVDGFVVAAENFESAYEGDKLEFIFTTDKSNPNVDYWLLKTIYNGTTTMLEGNENELNNWGCAYLAGDATAYRIVLTANDVENLREKGLFVNGYYVNMTKCNLLSRGYTMP